MDCKRSVYTCVYVQAGQGINPYIYAFICTTLYQILREKIHREREREIIYFDKMDSQINGNNNNKNNNNNNKNNVTPTRRGQRRGRSRSPSGNRSSRRSRSPANSHGSRSPVRSNEAFRGQREALELLRSYREARSYKGDSDGED